MKNNSDEIDWKIVDFSNDLRSAVCINFTLKKRVKNNNLLHWLKLTAFCVSPIGISHEDLLVFVLK